MSLRIAAQAIALPVFPLAFRRWQKMRSKGLCRHATKAGIYRALRKAGSPLLARWVLPVHCPDSRNAGESGVGDGLFGGSKPWWSLRTTSKWAMLVSPMPGMVMSKSRRRLSSGLLSMWSWIALRVASSSASRVAKTVVMES